MKVLADGKRRFVVLTEEPVDEANPTPTELAAGIDASCKVLASDFAWTFAASERITGEEALCDDTNSEELGPNQLNLAMTLWRYYADAGGVDATEDVLYAAVKTKGTTLWGYERLSDKESAEVLATGDEGFYARFEVDNPQTPTGRGGKIRQTIPCIGKDGGFYTVAGA